MGLATLIYRGLYDSLATVDISGGVLLAAIWFQTGYVALFRAMHGEDAGCATVPTAQPGRAATAPAPPKPAAPKPTSPWGPR